MTVQPYLFFNGRAEEAVNFYKKALGAEVPMLSRFGDAPTPPQAPNIPKEKIMHGELRIGDTVLLISDGMCSGVTSFSGFSLAITAGSETDAERKFSALADGGNIAMPMAETFFAKRFGQVTDKFGVQWMILFGASK